jgi:hypothetical protein
LKNRKPGSAASWQYIFNEPHHTEADGCITQQTTTHPIPSSVAWSASRDLPTTRFGGSTGQPRQQLIYPRRARGPREEETRNYRDPKQTQASKHSRKPSATSRCPRRPIDRPRPLTGPPIRNWKLSAGAAPNQGIWRTLQGLGIVGFWELVIQPGLSAVLPPPDE